MQAMDGDIFRGLEAAFPETDFVRHEARDGTPTIWVGRGDVREVVEYLKREVEDPYRTLFDLTAIDERERMQRPGPMTSDFTVVYHLLSYARNRDVRLKVPLDDGDLRVETVTDLWSAANW
jgi:NADH-quinone oxidoreductase subunit C/D